jgi:hypothetical protein
VPEIFEKNPEIDLRDPKDFRLRFEKKLPK